MRTDARKYRINEQAFNRENSNKRRLRQNAAATLASTSATHMPSYATETPEPIARRAFPGDELIVFPAGSHATEQAADDCISRIKSDELCGLIACGSGSVHDIARYSAHDRKIPFVSFPTAASVDGFASGVAAMTWHGRKVTFPSTPPIALFADDDVYSSAPRELLASGVGDIVGKYVSIFDWIFTSLLTSETVEDDIYKLENESLETVMHCDISSPDYPHGVMDCLVKIRNSHTAQGQQPPRLRCGSIICPTCGRWAA